MLKLNSVCNRKEEYHTIFALLLLFTLLVLYINFYVPVCVIRVRVRVRL